MSDAANKSISFLLLIVVGVCLRKKIKTQEHKDGIKHFILSAALPAMIFVGLQQVHISWKLVALPLLTLGFNGFSFLFTHLTLFIAKIPLRSPDAKTIKMLMPSLAPGLSCFPFLLEYYGETSLANAAVADMGNKFFVLIVLYLVALHWFYSSKKTGSYSQISKLGSLVKSLMSEPVNLVILVFGIMLVTGINYNAFPMPVRLTIDRISMLMAPLVFIFIGISVRWRWRQFQTIFYLLMFRSGFGFLCSGATIYCLQVSDPATCALILLFPQSCCSFWPYAHMGAINSLASKREATPPLFNEELAMNILALSLPVSTLTILCLSTIEGRISEAAFALKVSGGCFGVGFLALAAQSVKMAKKRSLDRRSGW